MIKRKHGLIPGTKFRHRSGGIYTIRGVGPSSRELCEMQEVWVVDPRHTGGEIEFGKEIEASYQVRARMQGHAQEGDVLVLYSGEDYWLRPLREFTERFSPVSAWESARKEGAKRNVKLSHTRGPELDRAERELETATREMKKWQREVTRLRQIQMLIPNVEQYPGQLIELDPRGVTVHASWQEQGGSGFWWGYSPLDGEEGARQAAEALIWNSFNPEERAGGLEFITSLLQQSPGLSFPDSLKGELQHQVERIKAPQRTVGGGVFELTLLAEGEEEFI